jgi:UDP-N-acetylmuramoyl-L-alanyl-D-glutamate--2,6-diaminopimelate ligase
MRLEESLAALGRVVPPPGRLERLGGGGRPLVVIDYAHSPDALENALGALSEIVARGGVPARLTCVFGCGGERDRGKRSQMGVIAARLADRVIVTSDNPRGEDPRRIAAEIAAGARGRCEIELDRARAIRAAVADAAQGDVILVAGKGHETYQEVAGRRLPFRDRTVAAAALARWRP